MTCAAGAPPCTRRMTSGRPILVGDALLTLAFEILADCATHPAADVRAELVAEVAKAAGARGVVQGQMLDLAAEKRSEPREPTIAHVWEIQRLKTGALIACACETGAILARATASERAALRAFGQQLGLAFQIADDLLDAEGDEAPSARRRERIAVRARRRSSGSWEPRSRGRFSPKRKKRRSKRWLPSAPRPTVSLRPRALRQHALSRFFESSGRVRPAAARARLNVCVA